MFKQVVNGLDAIFMWFGSRLKQNLSDYCELETAQSLKTLVASDGSLLTVVRIDGIRSLTGTQTFIENIVMPLNTSFGTYLEKKGHTMQFMFSSDPEKTREVLAGMMAPNINTCERLELDLVQMFEERKDILPAWSGYEECYVALWTDQSVLSKSEKKENRQIRKKAHAGVTAPMRDAQDPYAANALLIERHNTFVASMEDELRKREIILTPLNVQEATRVIRQSVDPEFTSDEWLPFLPGDPIKPQVRKQFTKAEQWDIVWPKLSWQVTPRDATIIEDKYVRVGDKIYAPIYIDLVPKETREFSELFSSLRSKGIPWRISYNLSGDGLSAVAAKGLFASILSFTSKDNKLLSESINELRAAQNSGSTIIRLKISLCTWTDFSNKDKLGKYLSELSSAVQNWGSSLVSDVTGDPVAGFISSTLGTTRKSIATTSAVPLDETIFMLPLKRPSSPWKSGGVIFRTPDGKLMPYQPGSSLQDTWISLIFAGPGSGKSVLMNALNLALATKEGNEVLPNIGIIDIGPSSSGLISLLRDALPSSKRHLVSHYRIQNTEEYCINPFDTQLGCRFPTAEESAFLSNLLTLVVTDANNDIPPDGMIGLVNAVIKEMYIKCSDGHRPKKYEQDVDIYVDEALKKCNVALDRKTSWWEVVDILFQNGYTKEAHSAQRYAVPILSDATEIAQEEKIKMIYENPQTHTTENIIQAFTRGVSEALDIYKVLSRPTKFDIGESRITAIDLDEVAKTGGPIADRQTAIMYMLARYVLAKNYKIIPETVNEMPYPSHIACPESVPVQKYKAYHLQRVAEMRDGIKRLCFDEFHRTSKSKVVREQVLVDMREGRKWNMDILLASQSLEDFDETMQEFTTSVFVMNGGNDDVIEKIGKVFGREDPAEQQVLRNGAVHGPRKGGGTFLAKFKTKNGRYTQLLSFTLGPVELWAFSTTAEEVNIRDRLYKSIGASQARKVLAAIYPSPSDAREEVINRKMKMKNLHHDPTQEKNVYEGLINDILEKYKKYHQR